jgi:hypothetical protein
VVLVRVYEGDYDNECAKFINCKKKMKKIAFFLICSPFFLWCASEYFRSSIQINFRIIIISFEICGDVII